MLVSAHRFVLPSKPPAEPAACCPVFHATCAESQRHLEAMLIRLANDIVMNVPKASCTTGRWMEAVCCRRQRELAAQKASERHGWQAACVPWLRSSCASAVLTWLSRRAGGCHKAACVLPRLPPPRLRLRMPWPCVAEMQQLVVQILRVGHVAMEQFPPESETGDELAELAMALVSLPVGGSSAATAPCPTPHQRQHLHGCMQSRSNACCCGCAYPMT